VGKEPPDFTPFFTLFRCEKMGEMAKMGLQKRNRSSAPLKPVGRADLQDIFTTLLKSVATYGQKRGLSSIIKPFIFWRLIKITRSLW